MTFHPRRCIISIGQTLTYTLDGTACGLKYGGDAYYFYKNLQGDVIAITDNAGTVIARYTYDAWGKVLSVTDANSNAITSATHVANINPFRYRSYYYDAESRLYYLQSRYYDPEVGRFLNADATDSLDASGTVLGYNLFAYAHNSPTNETDVSGKIIESLLFKIFAGVFCGFFIQLFDDVLNYLIQCIVKGRNNATFEPNIGDYLSSILSYTLKFVNPFGKSRIISTAISVYVPLAVKHGYKLISDKGFSTRDLILDILVATMNFFAACLLTLNQKNKIKEIKKHAKTKKEISAKKFEIKKSIKVCGEKIDLAFSISSEVINFILKWVTAFRG